MNLNALLHLTTLARIFAAMRRAMLSKGTAYVRNAKGKTSITVAYIAGIGSRFVFTDSKGRDITPMVLTALRG